jgi:hypothetical protein
VISIIGVLAVLCGEMKTSFFAMFTVSAVFLCGLCTVLTSANPPADLKAKLQAMDRLLSQKLLGDRAVLSRQPPSLVQEKRETMSKQQRKVKVRTPREFIVETEDDRTALNQLFAHFMKGGTHNQEMSDEDEAQIMNTLSKMKQRFDTLGSKLKGGFNCFESKVKNVFQENG